MSFKELSHTADVRMRIEAPALDMLFSEAFLALMQTVFGSNNDLALSGAIMWIRIHDAK
ncbi:MAG: archease [Methanomicrobiales archaeon]|nr:archease [Methanomicrobiales archaeon]